MRKDELDFHARTEKPAFFSSNGSSSWQRNEILYSYVYILDDIPFSFEKSFNIDIFFTTPYSH